MRNKSASFPTLNELRIKSSFKIIEKLSRTHCYILSSICDRTNLYTCSINGGCSSMLL